MRGFLFAGVTLAILKVFAAQAEVPTELILGEGESLAVSGRGAVRVGRSQVVKAREVGGKIILVARKAGMAVVTFDDRQYAIQVLAAPQARFFRAAETLLKKYKGLELTAADGQVHVSGILYRASDWRGLSRLASEHPLASYTFQATIFDNIRKDILDEVGGLARNRGLNSPVIRLTPQVEVTIPEKSPRNKDYEQVYRPWGLHPQSSAGLLALSPTVRLQLTFAEVSRSASSTLGLSYQDGQNFQLLPKFSAPQELNASLRLLENQGQARVLARPSVAARSGSEAEFLAGGEFPVRIATYKTREVAWKRHGIWLKFKPEAFAQSMVRLEVSSEMSIPDMSHAVDGLPSLKTTRVQTQVDLAAGHTIALSGLLRTTSGTSGEGIPGLQDLPVIGSLFGAQNLHRDHSELLIFITPQIVDPNDDEPQNLPENFADAKRSP